MTEIREIPPETEALAEASRGLDCLPEREILERLHAGQVAALASVRGAFGPLARAGRLMAETVMAGGRIVYAAAGSSALMANADGLELSGTFGLSSNNVVLLMAGGLPRDSNMPGEAEDDAEAGTRDAAMIRPEDLVIAVTASGFTAYPVAVAAAAQARGARLVAMANTSGAPIFERADVAVCLPTPPELIAGSTRMGAGTAQKAALNMMSSLMGIHLGQVFDGMMVGLRADNAKLWARATQMVARVAQVPEPEAETHLDRAAGAVKPAILLARGVASVDAAEAMLTATKGNLRAALAHL